MGASASILASDRRSHECRRNELEHWISHLTMLGREERRKEEIRRCSQSSLDDDSNDEEDHFSFSYGSGDRNEAATFPNTPTSK